MAYHFRLKVSCYYDINKTHAVVFNTRSRRSEPYAENAKGKLHVTMRVALGKSPYMLQSLAFQVFRVVQY